MPPSTEAARRPQNQSAADRAEATREVVLAPPPAPKPAKEGAVGSSLIEFSTIAGEDPNENIVFGDAPAHCKCPHCDRSVVTFIDYEASWVTYLLAFVVWVSLGWMAFWVLPLLWPAFKDVVHHCPRCLNVIERKSRINLPTFRTEVMTCKVGNCAVVLSRKYVAIMLGVVGLIISFYLLRSTIQLNTAHEEHKGAPSMLTWEDFLFDCGPRTSLSHRPSTAKAFEERYRRRTFKWQGEVRIIREGFDVLFVKTKSVVMIQMYPARYKNRRGDHPDVAVLFGDERNKEVGDVMPGDWVEFEATMSAHGYRGDPEVMVLWHIAKKERPDPLSSSAGTESHHPHEDDLEQWHEGREEHEQEQQQQKQHQLENGAMPAQAEVAKAAVEAASEGAAIERAAKNSTGGPVQVADAPSKAAAEPPIHE